MVLFICCCLFVVASVVSVVWFVKCVLKIRKCLGKYISIENILEGNETIGSNVLVTFLILHIFVLNRITVLVNS